MTPQIQKIQAKIYEVLNALDKTGTNADYYRAKFNKMTDAQFLAFCKKDLPFRFMTRPFEIEPTMSDCEEALDILGIPLLEKVALPYLYEDPKNGPVWSKPCMVVYIHVKKMKQFLVKKNAMSTSIDMRDMKTGLLLSHDKGGKTSDREMEALAVMGLDKTMKELSTYRADYMDAKSAAYQTIMTKGSISEKEVPISNYDSLAKNMLNAYMICSFINTNVLNVDYMLPKTIEAKNPRTIREVD